MRNDLDTTVCVPLLVILLLLGACDARSVSNAATTAEDSRGARAIAADASGTASASAADGDARDGATAAHPSASSAPPGMVWIPAGEFSMGGDDPLARADEKPRHTVSVDGFWMDATEVTNAQFDAFVKATGYVTTAERAPDWEELKKQVPPGTPKPPPDVLVAGSLVFASPGHAVELDDVSRWWSFVPGADWRHPGGPKSSIKGRETDPVVHVSWDDAVAYARWADKRLPTEAEWEWAARGGLTHAVHPWGDEPIESGAVKANTWQGRFPDKNTLRDGFFGVAPVKSFPANGYGLFDMAGNVWEWCSDFYRPDTYERAARAGIVRNPVGPADSFDPQEPHAPKRVHRGGSFLCHDSYCASYRVSARMKSSPDSGLAHCGFRCVRSARAQ